jgi:hypothetical protein
MSVWILAAHSSAGVGCQPGRQYSESRWMSGKPMRSAMRPATVVFPDPPEPITSTRFRSRLELSDLDPHTVVAQCDRDAVVPRRRPALENDHVAAR